MKEHFQSLIRALVLWLGGSDKSVPPSLPKLNADRSNWPPMPRLNPPPPRIPPPPTLRRDQTEELAYSIWEHAHGSAELSTEETIAVWLRAEQLVNMTYSGPGGKTVGQ